jgi:hydrogenase large subunit
MRFEDQPAPPSGGGEPYAYEPGGGSARGQRSGGNVHSVDFEPVSRVAGGLGFHMVVDLDRGAVLEAASVANVFRGYEVILQGRDMRDAVFVSSRACGVCGGAHATAASMALEMAIGIQPPPMGIASRNLLAAIEYLHDHPTHLFTRAGPDFSEPAVRATNPELWQRAEETLAQRADTHGYARVADIMTALTHDTGQLYLEALAMSRLAREAYVLIGGKYPHPQTTVAGGISSTIDASDLNVTHTRLVKFFDYSRKVVAVWDDLTDFFYEADPRFSEVGAGPMNFIDLGQWDDPFAYDGTFESSAIWGDRRWSTPGAIVGGGLRTTHLPQINRGVEEFVQHSFYEEWSGGNGHHKFDTDPMGNHLSPQHPWNKETIPAPGNTDWRGKYSWSTAPRWDRQPMETGPSARLWATALADRMPHRRFMDPTGRSLRMSMPQASLPATELEWHVPQVWNAFERNRARAYGLAQSTLVAYENLLIGYDLYRQGGPDSKVSTPFRLPTDFRVGAGFWGGGRGYISHHVELDDQVIQSYQIIGPSTFNASPMDPFRNPGPMEAAVAATPLLSSAQPEHYLDVLRAIRSFDGCMTCAAH